MDCGRLDQNAWVPRAVWRALERDFCLYLVTIVFALATHSAENIARSDARSIALFRATRRGRGRRRRCRRRS